MMACQGCEECSDDYYTSQTFMFTRPITQNLPARNSGWHNLIHNRQGDNLAAFQIIGLYQRSIPDAQTAQYFLFNNKNCLTVAGDNTINENSRDIRAEWLGLPSDFQGSFSINPRQSQMGVLFEYNQKISRLTSLSIFKHSWFSFSAPFVAVTNDIGFQQFDLQNLGTGDGPRDLAQAFTRKEIRYGKIGGEKTDFTLAHIRASFGTTYMSEDNFQIAYYSHFTFSGTDRDQSQYLFDVAADFNGHFGIGAGLNFQLVLNRPNDRYDSCLFLDFEHTYLIERSQLRTFDLKNKPWSRYLLLNHKDKGPNILIPAVNIFTLNVDIKPYSLFDFSCGLRVKTHGFEVELGYNLWGHADEKIDKIKCSFPTGYGIAGTVQNGDTKPRTASLSTVTKREATTEENDDDPDQTFVEIKKEDLNCHSAIARGAISHKAYMVISKNHRGKKIDGTFGIGAFYEYAQSNSVLKQWGLFGKMGASF